MCFAVPETHSSCSFANEMILDDKQDRTQNIDRKSIKLWDNVNV